MSGSTITPLQNRTPTAPLYTELPYPADGVVRTTIARQLRLGLARHAAALAGGRPFRLIDVGCGTGEITAGIARLFPQAHVTAIDINPASLAKAQELARREKLDIRFVQCDITRGVWQALQSAGAMENGPFDVVTSVGVLHHLADPQVGFAEVRQVVSQDGLFLCFLYSSHGRREDMAIKGLLTEVLPAGASFAQRAEALGLLRLADRRSLLSVMRKLRRRWKHGPAIVVSELLRVLVKRNRLTHLSDTVSNPCEHLYTLRQVKQLAADSGWSFVAVAEQAGMPVTPAAHTRNPQELALLGQMSEDALFDYFAFHYEAEGFTFFLRPA